MVGFRSSSSRNTTIGEQASVVINTIQDVPDMQNRMRANVEDYVHYHVPPTLDQAIVRIEPKELVFRVGTTKTKSTQATSSRVIECASNTNGLVIPKNQVYYSLYNDMRDNPQNYDQAFIRMIEKRALAENIRFIGVSRTDTSPNPPQNGLEKIHFSTQIHGTTTIRHTGNRTLAPGDIVSWDLMSEDEVKEYKTRISSSKFPTHPDKIPLKMVPMDDIFSNTTALVMGLLQHPGGLQRAGFPADSLNTTNGPIELAIAIKDMILFLQYQQGNRPVTIQGFNTWKEQPRNIQAAAPLFNNHAFQTILSPVLNSLEYMIQDFNRRKIGKVLSFAKPGDYVDILLGV